MKGEEGGDISVSQVLELEAKLSQGISRALLTPAEVNQDFPDK